MNVCWISKSSARCRSALHEAIGIAASLRNFSPTGPNLHAAGYLGLLFLPFCRECVQLQLLQRKHLRLRLWCCSKPERPPPITRRHIEHRFCPEVGAAAKVACSKVQVLQDGRVTGLMYAGPCFISPTAILAYTPMFGASVVSLVSIAESSCKGELY